MDNKVQISPNLNSNSWKKIKRNFKPYIIQTIITSQRKKIKRNFLRQRKWEETQAEKKPSDAARPIELLGSKAILRSSIFSFPILLFILRNLTEAQETRLISISPSPPAAFLECLTLLSYSSATSIAMSDIFLSNPVVLLAFSYFLKIVEWWAWISPWKLFIGKGQATNVDKPDK